MSIAVITANMDSFDTPMRYVEQTVNYDFYEFTGENFPLRFCSMSPRLQARIPKVFGWQMAPGYDFYIWVDRSYALMRPYAVEWALKNCQDVDLVVFKHPTRNTIQEEADYIKNKISENSSYIGSRYKNELIDEELDEIRKDKSFVDDRLFVCSVFVYRNSDKVHDMMKEWWYHTTRYHLNDQLSMPYVIFKSGCTTKVIETKKIPDGYLLHHYFVRVRGADKNLLTRRGANTAKYA